MNCFSRIDDKDKNIFAQEKAKKSRYNLYSQIVIENDKLKCARETYDLVDVCNSDIRTQDQPCTLLDTNEVVEIGNGPLL